MIIQHLVHDSQTKCISKDIKVTKNETFLLNCFNRFGDFSFLICPQNYKYDPYNLPNIINLVPFLLSNIICVVSKNKKKI